MNDTLSPFVAAYRSERTGSALDARALRERILDAAARRRRRRARLVTYLVPLAAVLAGSGALAASAPARSHLAALVGRVTAALVPTVERSASARPHSAAYRPSSNPRGPGPALHPVPDIPSAPPADGRAPAAPARVSAPAPAPPPTPAPVLSAPALTPAPVLTPAPASGLLPSSPAALAADIAAYRVAHRFHFVLADYARALRSWDGYLRRFPHGTFVPEARVNRAVCLARLGDTQAARSSLDAIARGSQGGPGQKQAANLLEALERAR